MNYIGDFPEDFTTVVVLFTTHDTNGAPVAPLSAFESDDVKIYKDGSASQKTSTNGLTMTSPFDSIVGLHCLVIDTSNDTGDAAFWVAGHTYSVVLNPDTETVNAQTALKVIATFTIAMMLRPTVLGRTLDVTTGGAAGIDWGNVENPTTSLNLSSTNIDTDQIVASVSGAVGSVTGLTASNLDTTVSSRMATYTQPTGFLAATFPTTVASTTNITAGTITTVSGNVNGSVGSVTGLTASDVGNIKTKTDFLPSATAGAAGGVFIAGTNAATVVTTSFTTTFTGNLTGNVGGTINGLTAVAIKDFFDTDSTTPYASAVAGSVVKEIADNAAGSGGPSAATIAAAVWDLDATGHQTTGTFGQAIGDPGADTDTIWAMVNALPANAADAVWDEPYSGHSAPASFGEMTQLMYVSVNSIPDGNANADALLDRADAIEAGLTPRQAMRLSAAADGGKLSGGATTTNTIRNAVADDKDRIIATVDSDGNRTAITYDLT